MMFRVEFERIGRGSRGTVKDFEADDADGLAEQIHRFADGKLASRWFDVSVELNETNVGTGSIEGGRFGTFTVEKIG